MFGPAVLGIVASVVIPAVSVIGITNVDHSATDEDAEATDVATAAAEDINADNEIDSIKNQLFFLRYSAVEEFQKDIEKYYQKTRKLPTQLKQLEPYTSKLVLVIILINILRWVKMAQSLGYFDWNQKKIYAVPEIRHKKIVGWTCYSIGIEDDLLTYYDGWP